MPRRPVPGVKSGPSAFPAISSPSSVSRPTPVVIKPAVKAKTGGPGNDAASSVGGDSAPVNPTSTPPRGSAKPETWKPGKSPGKLGGKFRI
jgi:hypothetical protein